MKIGQDTTGLPPGASWAISIHISRVDSRPVGSGVVIDARHIITCGHVVTDRETGQVLDELWIAFPKAGVPASVRMRVQTVEVSSGDITSDVAILTLAEAVPASVRPAPIRLVTSEYLVGHSWWAFGFPSGHPFGSVTEGTIDASLSYDWLRLISDHAYPLAQGFSGAGIWSYEITR